MTGAEGFRSTMMAAVLNARKHSVFGWLHRFRTNGKGRDDARWCNLFEDGIGGVRYVAVSRVRRSVVTTGELRERIDGGRVA